VKLIKENIPFTMVANEVLYNKNLSFKAKGLYSYLFSKPDTWDFSGDRIIMETVDGRKAIFSALKELEKEGYLFRNRLPSGKMEYNLKYSANNPMPKTGNRVEEPNAPNGYVPKRLSAETGSISNIEEKVINKENKEEDSSLKLLEHLPKEVIDELSLKFKCDESNIRTKANALADYCRAKGKKYKDYKAFLSNALRKDFGERPPRQKIPVFDTSSGVAKRIA